MTTHDDPNASGNGLYPIPKTDEINPHNPTNSAPDDRCRWCGKTHMEHDTYRRPNAPVPRVPCGGLVSGFLPMKTSTPAHDVEEFIAEFVKLFFCYRMGGNHVGAEKDAADWLRSKLTSVKEKAYHQGRLDEVPATYRHAFDQGEQEGRAEALKAILKRFSDLQDISYTISLNEVCAIIESELKG